VGTGYFKLGKDGVEISPLKIKSYVFHHVILEILEMMEAQLYQLEEQDAKLNYIVLTRDFLPNYYLIKSVKDKFKNIMNKVIAPTRDAPFTLSRCATYSILLEPYKDTTHRLYLHPD
jgi:hypothetical protein